MATKPKIVTLTNSSVDILNVIRNNATINYKNYVPVATADAESIREIGAIIMDSPQLQNEFLSALVNRIGRVLVTSKMYDNPWSMFNKGTLEFGETIEEIFSGTMEKDRLNIVALKGKVTNVRVTTSLDPANARATTCSVRWKEVTDIVEIPNAVPINTTVTPEEVKDINAMYNVNQVTKIMSLTKTAL